MGVLFIYLKKKSGLALELRFSFMENKHPL